MHKILLVSAAAALSLVAASCSKSHSTTAAVSHARDLTNRAVGDLLSGNQSLAVAKGKLLEAVASDPGNADARLFLAMVAALDQLEQSLCRQGGQLNDLLLRMGMQNTATGGSLWDVALQREAHGQGQIKDSCPDLGEVRGYLHDKVRPALEGVVAALTSLPPGYEFVIPAANGGRLLQLISPQAPIDLRLDYGDLQLAAAVLNGALAGADLLGVLDWASLQPNDFDRDDHPNLDALELLRTVYPTFGSMLAPGNLAQARGHVRAAWQCYQNASQHLRNETPQQMATGLLTLGRDTFASAQQLQEFLAAEAQLRGLIGKLVLGIDRDEAIAIDVDPVTGAPVPVGQQTRINLHRLFQGIDLRQLYFLTVVNPLVQKREFGVESLAQLTQQMATFDGVVAAIGGAAPTIGDLQELLYVLRVDAPASAMKSIDGDFADWQTAATKVASTGAAWIGQPAPDLGSVWVAVDANFLYVYLDRDLRPFLDGANDEFEVEMEGSSGTTGLRWTPGGGFQPWSQGIPLPDFVGNSLGLEMRFPTAGLPVGSWVNLFVRAAADNASWRFDSAKEHIYLHVR